ncbi:MAG TPA: hypothetical protein VM619_15090 [Luteimonas sp.]|nr:hypothetical protein [Luteimonas sp.]
MTRPHPRFHRARPALAGLLAALAASGCMAGIDREIDASIAQARTELHRDPMMLHAKGQPDAAITPDGAFTIRGEAVATSGVQREALRDYRAAMVAYGDAALDASAKEAGPLARRSMRRALFGALTGTEERQDRRIDEDSARLESRLRGLCPEVARARSAQQALADALPRFRPYANPELEDAEQCRG